MYTICFKVYIYIEKYQMVIALSFILKANKLYAMLFFWEF